MTRTVIIRIIQLVKDQKTTWSKAFANVHCTTTTDIVLDIHTHSSNGHFP